MISDEIRISNLPTVSPFRSMLPGANLVVSPKGRDLRTGGPTGVQSRLTHTCYSYRRHRFSARRGSHDESNDYRCDCRSGHCRRRYRQSAIALAFDRSCCSIVRDVDCGIDSRHKEAPDRGFRRPVAGFSKGDKSLSEGIKIKNRKHPAMNRVLDALGHQ